VIACLHLSKSYGAECSLFRGATLMVQKGETVVISGAAGSGKSTLLRILLAMEPPDSGQVLLLGRNVQELSPRNLAALRRKMGVVSPDGPLAAAWTVFENVALPLVLAGKESRFARKRVFQTLEALGLERKANTRCVALDASERRRVEIARAAVHNPLVLLGDEPFEGLEPEERSQVVALFSALNVTGGTLVLLSRSTPEMLGMAGARWVRLVRGRFMEGFSTSMADTAAAVFG